MNRLSGRSVRRLALFAGVVLLLLLALPGCSSQPQAAKYPTKPITLVVPWAAAASTDLISRAVAAKLSDKASFGVPVTVVNKVGGSGTPGTLEVLQSAPDGATILADCGGTSSVPYAWGKDLPFKIEERTYMARAVTQPYTIFVRGDAPWKTLDDVAAAIKKDPENFKWGWLGGTGAPDVTLAQLKSELMKKGLDLSKNKMVTYQGTGNLVPAIAGGHVDIGVGTPAAIGPTASAGKARIIALATTQRFKGLPDIPTTVEQGYPSVTAGFWVGFSGQVNLPQNIVTAWADAVKAIANDPAMTPEWDKYGASPGFLGPAEFRDFVLAEGKTIKALPVGN